MTMLIAKPVAEEVPVLFAGGAKFFAIPVARGGFLSIQVVWHNNTSAFGAPALFTSNWPNPDIDSTSLMHWFEETLDDPFDAVAAGAPGSQMRHMSFIGARYAKLRITPTADSIISIYAHGKS